MPKSTELFIAALLLATVVFGLVPMISYCMFLGS